MAYRREKRPVTVEKDVSIATCDNCGKEVDLPANLGMTTYPADWWQVGNGIRHEASVCSRECLEQWAAAAHPSSAELTNIARAAFEKQTAG